MILVPLCESITQSESDIKKEKKEKICSIAAVNYKAGLNCALLKFECGAA